MNEDVKARALHDEALRCRLEPIGAEWVSTGHYRIGGRIYDLTASDPNQLARILADRLAPIRSDAP